MTKEQIKQAVKLYKAYRCDTAEYRKLAERLGIPTTELNRRCWHITKGKPY
jgi:hypothetical protein